ncbi:insulinase family protein [bacterium]|nr:insulinase family protein [bacterium]
MFTTSYIFTRARFLLPILVFLLTLIAKPVIAQDLENDVVEYRLPNGMLWLLLDRPGIPSLAGTVSVKVGALDDPKGKSGLSHMLEHMAFKGTNQIGTHDFAKEEPILKKIREVGGKLTLENQKATPDKELMAKLQQELTELQKRHKPLVFSELDLIMDRNGAVGSNAVTSYDYTRYFIEMPGHKLELWAYIMSEMLFNSVTREFYVERDVVLEERRLRIDTSPWGVTFEKFYNLAFEKSPFSHLPGGTKKSIGTYTMEDVEKLHNEYYVPSNMVGAIVGNIDIDKTKKILKKHFGKYTAAATIKEDLPVEPKQTAERRATIKYDAEPRLLIGYHKPNLPHPDDYVFDIIYYILCDGRSSRLHKRLVEEEKIASNFYCDPSHPGNRADNLMVLMVIPYESKSPERIEKTIYDEIEKLGSSLVSKNELQKALNNILANFYFAIESNDDLAETLVTYHTLVGNWKYLITKQKIYEQITPEDIKRVVNKYMIPSNRTVVWQLKK